VGETVLVTGAAGLLGREMVRAATARGYHVVALAHTDLDVTDAPAVRSVVRAHTPTHVIHCAAYTAVDGAESEPELAMRVNRDGTESVAKAAAQAGAGLVYFSTDYVFDGLKVEPYLSSDSPAPVNSYGRSKLAGEYAAADAHPDPLIIRTGWLYGGGGSSFIQAILKRAATGKGLRVVDDQHGRPTWTRNLAEGTLELLDAGAKGVVHFADGGEATWVDLARAALTLSGYEIEVEPVSTEEWGAPAPRPRYSVLDLTATEAVLGCSMMHWREALRRFLEEESE
jgi:dTDP-4-dehydrorhamnose reductase